MEDSSLIEGQLNQPQKYQDDQLERILCDYIFLRSSIENKKPDREKDLEEFKIKFCERLRIVCSKVANQAGSPGTCNFLLSYIEGVMYWGFQLTMRNLFDMSDLEIFIEGFEKEMLENFNEHDYPLAFEFYSYWKNNKQTYIEHIRNTIGIVSQVKLHSKYTNLVPKLFLLGEN